MQAGEENEEEGEGDCKTPLPTMVTKVPRRDLFPSHGPTTQKTLVHKPTVPRDDELNDFEDDHERIGNDEELVTDEELEDFKNDPELKRKTKQQHDEFKQDPELRRNKEDDRHNASKNDPELKRNPKNRELEDIVEDEEFNPDKISV